MPHPSGTPIPPPFPPSSPRSFLLPYRRKSPQPKDYITPAILTLFIYSLCIFLISLPISCCCSFFFLVEAGRPARSASFGRLLVYGSGPLLFAFLHYALALWLHHESRLALWITMLLCTIEAAVILTISFPSLRRHIPTTLPGTSDIWPIISYILFPLGAAGLLLLTAYFLIRALLQPRPLVKDPRL